MKIKQRIKEVRAYVSELNVELRKYPKGLRLLMSIGLIISSALCTPIFWIPIPLGLFFFLLGGKIGLDLIKDWRKELKVKKQTKIRDQTMKNTKIQRKIVGTGRKK